MRQVNFTIIFIFCLAFALFTIQNTQSVPIRIIPGKEIQAPLSIELFLSMGVGAIMAWLFSIWTGLQVRVSSFKNKREVQAQETKIQVLEEEIEQWKAELEKQKQLLPASEAITQDTTATEVKVIG